MKEPPYGWTTQAKVLRVIDGDTVEVEIKRTVMVRLLDVDTAELRPKNSSEYEEAVAQKQKLSEKIKDKIVKLYIPSNDILQDVFTFGRALGRIFYQGKDINEYMNE